MWTKNNRTVRIRFQQNTAIKLRSLYNINRFRRRCFLGETSFSVLKHPFTLVWTTKVSGAESTEKKNNVKFVGKHLAYLRLKY